MGSIAELLGYTLDPVPTDAEAGEGAGSGASHAGASRADEARETAMAAVLAETGLEPEDARAELTLRGDLDLDDLALYAIVARIEHELRASFPDAEIAQWTTLGDVLDAAAERH
ncbi:phosphopantetheine-binding protein [Actinomyces culturomici]|uniref:phosphopantetheine-binding protein n=1 Tax=Actinomyces culturomici TaxID=1926276 RepID=UPI001F21B036|nr:phosphopantetheine-binding protein [Actinomyces culturomici]